MRDSLVYNAAMRHQGKLFSALFACGLFSALAAGCAEDGGYECTVTWSDGDTELGSATLTYEDASDANAAVALCNEAQATHESRPEEANKHQCSCATI